MITFRYQSAMMQSVGNVHSLASTFNFNKTIDQLIRNVILEYCKFTAAQSVTLQMTNLCFSALFMNKGIECYVQPALEQYNNEDA